MRVAIVDDDPVEQMLLTEMMSELAPHVDCVAFTLVEDLLAAGLDGISMIFLDRRIPPHSGFSDTLPLIIATGFSGRVILMTAHDPGIDLSGYDISLEGPFDKLELINPETLTALLSGPVKRAV